MAKKEYTSLFIQVLAFSSEDVLTESPTVESGIVDENSYVWGTFIEEWLTAGFGGGTGN